MLYMREEPVYGQLWMRFVADYVPKMHPRPAATHIQQLSNGEYRLSDAAMRDLRMLWPMWTPLDTEPRLTGAYTHKKGRKVYLCTQPMCAS